MSTVVYHVTSSINRGSIAEHGLDWRPMGDEPGVAGSPVAEEEGVFLARDSEEAEWFVSMGRRHHLSLDVWEVTLEHDLDVNGDRDPSWLPYLFISGFLCAIDPISPDRLRLVREKSLNASRSVHLGIETAGPPATRQGSGRPIGTM
jgi:hypothetical protein